MKLFSKIMITFFGMSFMPLMAFAAISSVELKGVVKSFDEKSVTVQQSASTVHGNISQKNKSSPAIS